MTSLPEHQKPFFTTLTLSLLTHIIIFSCVIFTITASAPSATTFFSFLGSVLNDRDVMSHKTPEVSIPNKPILSTLDLKYGAATAIQDAMRQIKPQATPVRSLQRKIYIKSTFLPSANAQTSSPSVQHEQFQLKEPLHVPLKLETHDQN